jgi:hypothetical protein
METLRTGSGAAFVAMNEDRSGNPDAHKSSMLVSILGIGLAFRALSHYVRANTMKSGTYDVPDQQTNPNRFKFDN